MPFGLVPTDLPLIVPPSHSLQPRLQLTDIHMHVWPMSQTELGRHNWIVGLATTQWCKR